MVQTDSRPETEQSSDGRAATDGKQADIAERPQLAPNVVLSGEMQDGAYQDAQWLVQRDGQFVQLTELLYRVAEQIDGRRDLEEIAQSVTDSINRKVSSENIRQLLTTKLVPLGLVATADGSVVQQQPADGTVAARSPLQINMRVRALSPRLINPLTAVLQGLFWPPILVALIAAAVAAQVYVFVVHGVASSFRDVLYHPVLMFALLGLIIAGTVWHEFGHASALRYGGGEVRGMGVGIYLVYPAFYTDVTDNYRLPRWSKVRTDLGGFYFNLIWCAGTVGLFLLTHVSWLLLLVLLIDLEIIQQILPFGRYDGYWTLADITGVPDFFSRIPGFIRFLVPFAKTKDEEFSRYKLWVRVVFALYIVVAAPVMAFIFFMMIKNAPHVLATGWDSARAQTHAMSVAQSHGDMLNIAFAGMQLLILALPTIGMIYIVFNLARRGGKALWNYSKPSAGRRIKGGLIAIGVMALLAYLWAPQLSFGGGRPGPWYAASSWKPIGPNEQGTIGDAGNSLAEVPVPYNPFHTAPIHGVTVNATATAAPQAVATAHAKATARAQATAHATPTPGATATAQAGAAANPVTPTGTVLPTLTIVATQPAGAGAPPPPATPTAATTYIPTVPPTTTP